MKYQEIGLRKIQGSDKRGQAFSSVGFRLNNDMKLTVCGGSFGLGCRMTINAFSSDSRSRSMTWVEFIIIVWFLTACLIWGSSFLTSEKWYSSTVVVVLYSGNISSLYNVMLGVFPLRCLVVSSSFYDFKITLFAQMQLLLFCQLWLSGKIIPLMEALVNI